MSLTERYLSEGEIIKFIREILKKEAGVDSGLTIPPGDDAAMFHFCGGDVLLTVDSVFEGVHFTLDTHSLQDVGWKAAARGVSDIAAMGGQPLCALLSLGLAEPISEEEISNLITGFLQMLNSCNCVLAGGDVSRSRGGLFLNVTVAGVPGTHGPVRRCGARVGEVVGVTGFCGQSAGGLHILKSGKLELRSAFPELVEAHLRPVPKVIAGQVLASSGVSAMEDLSDGLAADLSHLCEESRVGCLIYEELIPVSESLLRLAGDEEVDPFTMALEGGEDYELIFTAPSTLFDDIEYSCVNACVSLTRIGEIVEEERGLLMVRTDGKVVNLSGMGYEHFKKT